MPRARSREVNRPRGSAGSWWWALLDSNQRPSGYEPVALTTELRARAASLAPEQRTGRCHEGRDVVLCLLGTQPRQAGEPPPSECRSHAPLSLGFQPDTIARPGGGATGVPAASAPARSPAHPPIGEPVRGSAARSGLGFEPRAGCAACACDRWLSGRESQSGRHCRAEPLEAEGDPGVDVIRLQRGPELVAAGVGHLEVHVGPAVLGEQAELRSEQDR